MINRVYIGIGSNIQDRTGYLKGAMELLGESNWIEVINYSSIYETDPVGFTEQDPFLNMIVEITTSLSAPEVLEIIQGIEKSAGRKREIKWGPRTLDLDILLFNQQNIETEELIVPHPRMCDRAFVIIPLMELNKGLMIQGKSIIEIYNGLKDRDGVQVWKQKSGEDVFELFAN
jgi:2-amino-4-hydroxy-6-hydroxymethyldihydropteridine diphosphokinase